MTVTTLSFLSNLSTLQPLPHHSSTSLTSVTTTINRYSSVGRICCRKIDDQPALVQNDGGLNRRDVLKCVGVTIGIEVLASPVSFVETASAADLIQLRQRSDFLSKVKGTLFTAIKANPELVPSILTLALNDAMTYDKATKTGGPNGSIRLSSEISRPENQGLSAALSLLEELKKEIDSYSKGGPISYADLFQYAAQSSLKRTFLDTAIRKCGGNEEKGNLLYTAYGSNGQWGLFEKQLGRSDTQEPDPEGRVPQWQKASVQEMKDKFTSIGFGPRQLAVMSAFLGPDQIQTEALLASDPDVLPWVQKYQRSRETVSETDYEVDLITTLTKMSTLGNGLTTRHTRTPSKKLILANSNYRKSGRRRLHSGTIHRLYYVAIFFCKRLSNASSSLRIDG